MGLPAQMTGICRQLPNCIIELQVYFIYFTILNNTKSTINPSMLPQHVPPQADNSAYKKIQHYYYQPSQTIGKGNFSHVYRGINKTNNKLVAIKVIKNNSLTSTVAIQLLKNQISILKQLQHQNVIQCLDVFVSQNHHYIVTEYCDGGDLEKVIEKNGFMEEKDSSRILYGIFKGLLYLNQENIVHRDLKPANIFLNKSGVPKIADFGFAVKHNKVFKDINIGSPIYMSPEGLLKREYGPKTQVWALGILVYEMLHGYTPLSKCQTEAELKQKVLVPPIFRSGVSQQAREFIQACLNINQKQRSEMRDIENTSFMRKVFYEVQGFKKDLLSTRAFSQSTQNSAQLLAEQVKTYDEGLALLHYCRLIHKTTQDFPSTVLSQWLLNLCWGLQKVKIHCGDKEQNDNLMSTIHSYWMKYYEEHKSKGMIILISDVKFQCELLIEKARQNVNSSSSKSQNNLIVLLKQTQLLEKYGQSNKLSGYAKSSQLEKYLQALSHAKHNSQGTNQTHHQKNNQSLKVNLHRLTQQGFHPGVNQNSLERDFSRPMYPPYNL